MKRIVYLLIVLFLFGVVLLPGPPAWGGEEGKAPEDKGEAAPKKAEGEKPAKPKDVPPKKEEQPKDEGKTPPKKEQEKPPAPPRAAEPAWPWAKKPALEVHGEITERYRIRTTEGESDQDFEGLLDLTIKNLYKDRVSFHLNGGVFWDTWGRQDSRYGMETFYFADIYDTYETKAQGRIYTLFVEYKEITEGADARFGRQLIHKGEHLHFDGISLSYSPSPIFEVTIGGGLPVYFSETRWVTNFVTAAYLEFYPGYGIEDYPDRASKL
ncbi:MAG: hypothetical protein ACYTHM_07150, partial [Planctomycetota bacterium]